MYCPKCYRLNDDENQVCSSCGASLQKKPIQVKIKPSDTQDSNDTPSIIMNIVGLLMPLIGFIMFCFMYNRTPKRATFVGKCALIGFIARIFLLCWAFSQVGISIW